MSCCGSSFKQTYIWDTVIIEEEEAAFSLTETLFNSLKPWCLLSQIVSMPSFQSDDFGGGEFLMCIFANNVDVKEYGQTQDIMFLIGVYMYSPATFIC